MVLVTGAALNGIQALSIRSAPHLHRMLVAVVALAREVSGGVAIHAARMPQHRKDGFKRCSCTSSCTSIPRSIGYRGGFGMFGLRNGIECQQEDGQGVGSVSHIHALAEP
jgi:hypothetical protein